MHLVGKEFRDPARGIDLRDIGQVLHMPTLTLEPIVLGLENNGLLTNNEKDQLLPGREIARIRLSDIVAVVRHEGETGSHDPPNWSDAINSIGQSIDVSVDNTLGDRTLAQLLDAEEA